MLIDDIRRFQGDFQIAEDGPVGTEKLLAILATIPVGGRQIHDANIMATMQAHGIARLLTHNLVDFARYKPSIAIEPLLTT